MSSLTFSSRCLRCWEARRKKRRGQTNTDTLSHTFKSAVTRSHTQIHTDTFFFTVSREGRERAVLSLNITWLLWDSLQALETHGDEGPGSLGSSESTSSHYSVLNWVKGWCVAGKNVFKTQSDGLQRLGLE